MILFKNISFQLIIDNTISLIKQKMYAAPTAEQDFTLLHTLRKLNWKQQLTYLETLISTVPTYDNPSQIEICLLGMLQQKNINVLNKIFKLIKCYVEVYGITMVSLRQFVGCVLAFSSTHQNIQQEIILEIVDGSVKSQQHLQDVLKGIEDLTISDSNIESILRIGNKLLKTKYVNYFIRSCLFEKILVEGFSCGVSSFYGGIGSNNSINANTNINLNTNILNNNNNTANTGMTENYLTFLKSITQIYTNNTILLARKHKFSPQYITFIKQLLLKSPTQNFQPHQHHLQPSEHETQISYTYDLSSQEWLEDYKMISVKCICLSLKQAANSVRSRSMELDLNQKFLNCLLWLSQKRNKNINKYFFDIIASSISRSAISQNNQLLLEVLFETLTDKKLTQKLKSQPISTKQQLWLNLTTESYLRNKIQISTSQQQYHRIVIYLQIIKKRQLMDVKSLCEDLLRKENLSMVYRVRLEHIDKQ